MEKEKSIQIDCIPFDYEMVFVEGGTFWMGAQKKGKNCDESAFGQEAPVHKVTLSDYYIGKYQVTQELWKAVMGDNPSTKEDNKCPVDYVSWDDCQKFIEKLNQKMGLAFALPTEAQWEYAARGGNKSKGFIYSGGGKVNDEDKELEEKLGEVAWYGKNSNNCTQPVGGKAPNELELYDMSGNVWEWCEDLYGEYKYSKKPQTDPRGPKTGEERVVRGGSSLNEGGSLKHYRVTNRHSHDPMEPFIYSGLRLVHPLFFLNKSELKFPAKGGNQKVTITSIVTSGLKECKVEPEQRPEWLTITPAPGEKSGTTVEVTFDVRVSETADPRNATVTLTINGKSKSLTVEQEGPAKVSEKPAAGTESQSDSV